MIAYIFGGEREFAQRSASLWLSESPTFVAFMEKYRDKIRAKVRRCGTDDALRDLLWELEIAHLLLKNADFEIEYEPYGTGGLRSPDYRVSVVGGGSFNLEATRIRGGSSETRFQVWEKEIKEAVRAVPSQVGVALNIGNLLPDWELLDRLESRRDFIKASIVDRIAQADAQLLPGQSQRYSIPGFDSSVELDIIKPERKYKPNRTSYYLGEFPIWFTQREFRKFSDIVCGKLGQLRESTANVLVVGSRSITHEPADCEDAISELTRLAMARDDAFFQKKEFQGTSDFRLQYAKLSVIVFRNSFIDDGDRNFVWSSPQAANPVDERVTRYFAAMD